MQNQVIFSRNKDLPQSSKYLFLTGCLYIKLVNCFPTNFPLTLKAKTQEDADGYKLHVTKIIGRIPVFHYSTHRIAEDKSIDALKPVCLQLNFRFCRNLNVFFLLWIQLSSFFKNSIPLTSIPRDHGYRKDNVILILPWRDRGRKLNSQGDGTSGIVAEFWK